MSLSLSVQLSFSHPQLSSSRNPISRPKPNLSSVVPARDRTIDFGKHKGRMLGTLPSKYLAWISKNLRARDFQHWAELADEVLVDPVYRDRIEWESAERILSGNSSNTLSSSLSDSPVRSLLELSQRFGWDNEDKKGWARIDFGLLGTSKGGRIPRVYGEERGCEGSVSVEKGVSGKREERGERRRAKRGVQLEMMMKKEVKVGVGETEAETKNERSVNERMQMRLGVGDGAVLGNPFPGRGALLDQIKRGQ